MFFFQIYFYRGDDTVTGDLVLFLIAMIIDGGRPTRNSDQRNSPPGDAIIKMQLYRLLEVYA